jgi:hypothetical protein
MPWASSFTRAAGVSWRSSNASFSASISFHSAAANINAKTSSVQSLVSMS